MATVRSPSSVAARITRMAISLRLATSSLCIRSLGNPRKVGRYCGVMRMICKMDSPELFDAVYRAAGRAEVRHAVGQVYEDLARAVSQQKPVCNTSGRCCRFEEFGHRLYVTTMELAAFVYELQLGSA